MNSMQLFSMSQRAAKWLLVATLFGAGFAMAQAEPTLNEVYATAQSGKLDQAQVMIQQVLISHPKSAKANFVRAELYARQGDLDRARESLATADKLLPGLGFAKPEAVQALRTQLAGRNAPRAHNNMAPNPVSAAADSGFSRSAQRSSSQQPSSSSWALPLLLAGVAIAAGYFIFRRRVPEPVPQAGGFGMQQGGLSGPQTFGMGGGGSGGMPVGYPPAGGYPQPTGSGLGGRIMGGVATGLAVGAGVMAAEAIGRNLMGHHNNADASQLDNDTYRPNGNSNSNPDMGGADFGINDGGSWDSGGGSDGGGDWDN
jgi:hypothetical protein